MSGTVFLAGAALLASDALNAGTELKGELPRNSYGGGSRKETLDVTVGDPGAEREEIEVEISERAYTEEEIDSMFKRCSARLDKLILGDNESFDHVESDLDLVTEIKGVPAEISWELDRYDIMNIYGQIQETEIEPEGVLVALKGTITYTEDEKKQALYERSVRVCPKSAGGQEQKLMDVRAAIREADERTRTSESLSLPDRLGGEHISYFPKMDSRGGVLMAMAVLTGALLIALEKQNEGERVKKEQAQMQLDYPEIVSRLTLFISAGMTVRRSWRRITEDYEREKTVWGIRRAYEEMRTACNEMDSGITEAESYERFGRRCGLQEYIRLGTLLSQNLRKGTRDLSGILRMEAAQSFEDRKARAKRLGEEAGTKLLAPMFLMLAEVLVIVIVPAFMSVQM